MKEQALLDGWFFIGAHIASDQWIFKCTRMIYSPDHPFPLGFLRTKAAREKFSSVNNPRTASFRI